MTYAAAADYLAEDSTRGALSGLVEGDLGGWDVADGFRLAETVSNGPESEWRISVVNDEVYAVLRRFPGATLYTFEGPVWLIDRIPARLGPSVHDEPIRLLMREVELLKNEPDSLLRVTHLIRTCCAVIRSAELVSPADAGNWLL